MPEIKHVFSQGKMNKDLDERLVPNGQYRDALNIQVSTSEGSDVGTVQNILGNKGIKFNVPANSTCIGAIADEKNNSLYWFVTSEYIDMILEYKEGVITPVIVDTNVGTSNAVLKFPDKIITGINIIDNLLFWTDNETEPKKINIDLCKQGTNQNGYTHTYLIVPDRNITAATPVKIREEHITVIKKSPKKELILSVSAENVIIGNVDTTFTDSNGDAYGIGDTFIIQNINITRGERFREGESVYFLNSTNTNRELSENNFDIRLKVLTNLSGFTPPSPPGITFTYPPNSYEFEVEAIRGTITGVSINYNIQQGGNNEKFFDKKFVRFSYRYKYQDGEYSCFAPFSQIAFVPSFFDYQTKFAYNQGMENYLSELILHGFRQTDILENVVQIDILYKESNSPIVYLVDKIKFTDIETTNFVDQSGFVQVSNYWNANRYKITSDIIYAALPSNQLIRPWDNVPKKALAQEVTGNRIVYGNYIQNYDIRNAANEPEKPVISAWYKNRFDSIDFDSGLPLKSLKSLREYQLGVVYTDEYGRETPVFSNTLATFKVPKIQSGVSNKIITKFSTPHPTWAEGFKFYIKETANEYYNLAMDRVYEAEDGNLWLSFPSSERNKIDEETFLILKKSRDSSAAIEEEAKYKVIAIENEAPEFIKTLKKELLITNGEDDTSVNSITVGGLGVDVVPIAFFFDGITNGTPQINSSRFLINKTNWLQPIDNVALPDLLDISERISITFSDASGVYSEAYRILDITADNPDTGDSTYSVILETPIKESDSWIYPSLLDDSITNDTENTGFDTNLQIIIHTYVTENRPEFAGRFFVKINSDEFSRDNVFRPSLSDLSYETLAFATAYYFSDTGAPNMAGATGTSGNNHTSGGEPLVEYDTTTDTWNLLPEFADLDDNTRTWDELVGDSDDWVDLLDTNDPGDGEANSQWFVDQAYFRGEAPLQFSNTGIGTTHGISHTRQWGGFSGYEYSLSFDWLPAVLDSKTKAEQDPNWKQGVYEENGQWYIELSYSQLNNSPLVNAQMNGDDTDPLNIEYRWNIPDHNNNNDLVRSDIGGIYQDSIWEVDASQRNFVDNLKLGTIFKFDSDNNEEVKYEISGNPQKLRRYNHTNFLDFRIQHFQRFVDNQIDIYPLFDRFISSDNRRITYKIPIKIYSGGSGSILEESKFGASNQNILQHFNATTPVSITFLKERYGDGYLSTDNPTIWETVPKESIDLDVYYEASQVYPIALNHKTSGVLIAVGSKVTCATENTVPADTKVLQINGDIIKVSNDVNDSTVNQDDLFTFTDEDGAYVKLKFHTLVGATEDAGGNNISQFIKFRGIHNEFGLAWNNCYSFGNGIESNRLRDDFNQVTIDKGAKASAPIEETYEEEKRTSGLIYSGLYNSTSGVNNLNQFIQAERITKDLNPTYGSIQKLFSRNTDLIALCENRVIKILSNKDAVFNADGNTNLTATNKVLGQAMPFSGDYGISKNPESFAVENFRAYFTDKQRGAVLRLSMDGLTPISEYGLSDYFSDNLKNTTKLIGNYDGDKNNYNITLFPLRSLRRLREDITISYDEKVKGWSSFKSFVPEQAVSLSNDYYTFKHGQLYKHHQEDVDRNTFYNKKYLSSISVLLNEQPGIIKNFKTLNYEGSQSNVIQESTNVKTGYYNLINKQGWYAPEFNTDKEEGLVSEFVEKEGKWFNFIKGKNVAETLDIKTDDFSFQGIGNYVEILIDSDLYIETPPIAIPGCMDIDANNYNALATVDDGSCIYTPPVSGCMNPNATNYNPLAVVDDGSCILPIYGCTDPLALNYDDQATVLDGSCLYVNPDEVDIIAGCTDPTALNYNPHATVDDKSCMWVASNYGCTDPSATNYDPNATIDDGSCEYSLSPQYSITFSDSGINSTGPYTSNFNAFGIFTRGFVFNGNGNPLVLSNTYSPGDIVNELVTIELTPHSHPTIPNKEIVYDFPIPGGPNPNITQTPGYTNQGDQWGDAKNNLTGTSIRILNMNDQTVTYADAGPFSQWHNSVDPTGFQPRFVTTFGLNPGDGTYTSHIITTDPNGNPLHIPTASSDPLSTFGGVGTVEWYYSDSDPQLNDNPGYEWFPYKVWLSINIKDFVMPAHDVDVVLQIDHNTENQGDPNWVAPGTIYGCTDSNASNFDPGANVDDGSCLYTDDDGEEDDDPLGDA